MFKNKPARVKKQQDKSANKKPEYEENYSDAMLDDAEIDRVDEVEIKKTSTKRKRPSVGIGKQKKSGKKDDSKSKPGKDKPSKDEHKKGDKKSDKKVDKKSDKQENTKTKKGKQKPHLGKKRQLKTKVNEDDLRNSEEIEEINQEESETITFRNEEAQRIEEVEVNFNGDSENLARNKNIVWSEEKFPKK